MSRPATDRLVLLAGQAFSLGMLSALVVIAANALFLTEYGSQGLPYTYIGIAAVGVPASMMLARALRRWRLPLVASVSMAGVTVLYLMAWVAVKAGACELRVWQPSMIPTSGLRCRSLGTAVWLTGSHRTVAGSS